MKKIMYSAVVLADDSHANMVNKYGNLVPEGWKLFAHHMTIIFGKGLPEEVKDLEGETVELNVTHIGLDKRVIAFKVDGFPSANDVPHITFAVNVTDGAKPVESNNMEEWVEIVPFKVRGVVTEIPK